MNFISWQRALRGIGLATLVLLAVANMQGQREAFSATAAHGWQDFAGAGNYSWTAPAGVTVVYVELWGAGGGGSMRVTLGQGGYGGGSGAYQRTALTVIPGVTYTVHVGAGGLGDSGAGAGQNGEDTTIADAGGVTLTAAGGGKGGSRITLTPGAGGTPDPAAGLRRNGRTGAYVSAGTAIVGSVEAPYPMDGGSGAGPKYSGPGFNGGAGYAILKW
jgi:hypothetical protein